MITVNNKKELKALIKQRIEEQGPNCDLNDIDVSGITDMSYIFFRSPFKGDISKWDVSRVQNMKYMFYESPLEGNEPDWYKTEPDWYKMNSRVHSVTQD